jgi:cytochrome c oxidase cbb3-type subunit 3
MSPNLYFKISSMHLGRIKGNKSKMKRVALLLAALAALEGCSKSELHSNERMPVLPSSVIPVSSVAAAGDLELGRRIYNFRCYYCHGYSGNARTLAATFLNPKPVDFTSISPNTLSRERILQSIQSGRPGTAMMSFNTVLQPNEIAAVTDFVRQEFMVAKAENTRYHTEANGWFNHSRYISAYPFALGEIPLDTPWEQLTPEQATGKRLFMTSCVSCHDRGRENNDDIHWESRAVSYPRNQFSPGDNLGTKNNSASTNKNSLAANDGTSVDATASATPYALHDRPPKLNGLTETEARGEGLFQKNCAFCHAADGTARNWIGSFMEPHPRDLTKSPVMDSMTRARLRTVIREGLPGTSMPAWKSVFSEQQIEDVISYVGRAFHPLAAE